MALRCLLVLSVLLRSPLLAAQEPDVKAPGARSDLKEQLLLAREQAVVLGPDAPQVVPPNNTCAGAETIPAPAPSPI